MDPETTKMFKDIENPMLFHTEAMTFNNRDNGITLESFQTDAGLAKMFTATSITTDPTFGDVVVASMESPDYPFLGT